MLLLVAPQGEHPVTITYLCVQASKKSTKCEWKEYFLSKTRRISILLDRFFSFFLYHGKTTNLVFRGKLEFFATPRGKKTKKNKNKKLAPKKKKPATTEISITSHVQIFPTDPSWRKKERKKKKKRKGGGRREKKTIKIPKKPTVAS
jgi:hypothetical protein